jgi:hypothetical protein
MPAWIDRGIETSPTTERFFKFTLYWKHKVGEIIKV